MPMYNVFMQALLEASEKSKAKTAEDVEETETPAEDTTTEEEDTNVDDKSEGENDETSDENEDTSEDENEDENKEDENQDDQSEEPTDDDFSMNPDDEPSDEEPPDGLTDPDDDGSGDEATDDQEVNVQTNILQLSKLDRTLAKRKCYNDYQDLRVSISSFKTVIDDNEAAIEPEIRDTALTKLDKLYSTLTDYLTYKFIITNYEENLNNYLLFAKTFNEIVTSISPNAPANKRKPKKSQN